MYNVVIIGVGLTGLLAGSLLTMKRYKVVILEEK